MEFAVWIYKPLEQAQIDQLLGGSLDLSVRYDKNAKNREPKQPLSGKKAELVLHGTALRMVHPSMEYQRVRRHKFLSEPILSYADGGHTSSIPRSRGEEAYEEIGISTLRVKGRLYYASHESYDTLKLCQWASEEADEKDSGFRTVVFASLQDQKGTDAAHINFRKIVLPKAFVLRYEECYDDKDGMGTFEAVFQQSTAELMACEKQIAEAAWKEVK